jgi:hypothetical protein
MLGTMETELEMFLRGETLRTEPPASEGQIEGLRLEIVHVPYVTAYKDSRQSNYFLERVSDDYSGNRILYLPEADISVLEEARAGAPSYFAWNGIAGDINHNYHTARYATIDEAIDEAIGLRYLMQESDAV